MIEQSLADTTVLRTMFTAEQPHAEAAAGHLAGTGHGRWWLDRPDDPRAVAVEVAGNWLLRGDPDALPAHRLRGLVKGFVDAPAEFEPTLRAAAERITTWERIYFVLDGEVVAPPTPDGAEIRQLRADDAGAIAGLCDSLAWITRTWGGPAGLAANRLAWGAFVDGALVSMACTFFLGFRHEELAVVTEPHARRRGLSTACAAGLCEDIRARGRRPSWSTSTANAASRGTAERLGFHAVREGLLYAVDVDVPPDDDEGPSTSAGS
jgi:GNAT superfamily N-acetyltransferase